MEIHFYGANCIRITDKKINIVVDDNLQKLGVKSATQTDDIVIFTQDKEIQPKDNFLINGPGEYEIAEVSIRGVPAKAYLNKKNKQLITMYSIQMDGFSVGVTGNIHPDLSDEQLETLGLIDILVIPVGDGDYTLDANAATRLVKRIEPKIVIPTHYADDALKYEVAQAPLQKFLNEMGISDVQKEESLKVKGFEFGDKTKVIVLNRTVAK